MQYDEDMEKQRLLAWNATGAGFPREKTLHDLCMAQAQRTPERIAATFAHHSLSYTELDEQSNQLAHHLRSLGVGPQTLVGVYVERSLRMLVGVLGVIKAGAAYVPIDPDFPATRIKTILEDAQPVLLLTDEGLSDRLDFGLPVTLQLDHDWPRIAAQPKTAIATDVGPEDLLYVIYTSGSTGTPKGVEITHRSAVNLLWSMRSEPGLSEEDHLLAVTTIAFDPALYELFLPLLVGARLTIASREETVDGALLQQLIDDAGITFMRGTPTNWRILLESGWQGKHDLKVLSGGEALTSELAKQLLSRSASLWNMFGPTETTVACTYTQITADFDEITIGRPFHNNLTYILDAALQPVPIGETGELYIGGECVARGYLNRPELTAQRFVPNPFIADGNDSQARMYKTGDLARYLPDGRIVYLGRNDFQVKIRGYRIELGDIEAAISHHPAVAHTVTTVRDLLDGNPELVSYIIPEAAHKLIDPGELRHYLRETLPRYMVPAHIVILDSFPVMPNGKINRRALPLPEATTVATAITFQPPSGDREHQVAALFAAALGLPRVGRDDSFFDLGVNSLLAARCLYQAKEQLGVHIPFRALLDHPTVAELSAYIDSVEVTDDFDKIDQSAQNSDTPPAPITIDVEEETLLAQSNLTRGQFLMWMGQRINPDAPLYNVLHAFTIRGDLDVAAFQQAFQTLVNQNDALRTVISEVQGVPQQRVLDHMPADMQLLDLSGLDDPHAAYHAWVEEHKAIVPNLDERLFVTALIKLGPQHFAWYLCQHHIVTDAVSSELLFERLAATYQLALDDRLADSAQPPQYAEFVQLEQERRETPAYQQAAAYWQEKTAEPLSPIDFYGRGHGSDTLRTTRVVFDLGAERSAALRQIAALEGFGSPSADLSLFTLFATLLTTTLHRISGQRRIRLGTPFHGRPNSRALDAIGLFIEMGVLQVDIEDGESFISLGDKIMADTLESLTQVMPGISRAQTNRAYDVVLNFIQATYPQFAGLAVTRDLVDTGHIDAAHALRLQVTDFDGSGSYVLFFDLKEDIFGETERSWFVEHFVRVVDMLISDRARGLGSFALLEGSSYKQLFVDFNDTTAPYPANQTVVQLFAAQVQRTPDAAAAVAGDELLTYAALNQRANQLAHYLQARGIGPETAVAICMERSLDALIAIWGILKAGGAYIPIDPAYPAERIELMVRDAKPGLILASKAGVLSGADLPLDTNVVTLAELDLNANAGSNPQPTAGPENLAYMIYTSGSTGVPKGTMLTHQGLLNYIWWARRTYQEEGEVLDFPLYSSLAFDLTITSVFVPLLSGGKIVVYGEDDASPGLEILSVFRDDLVDIVKLTPAHLSLIRELQLGNSRVRKLIVGGEDFKTDLARSIHDLFDGDVVIYNEYGPTEAVVGCMIHQFDPQRDTAVSVPIGTPAANARIYLLDDYDQPVPRGVVGEMVISSDGVARGYHQRPELTAERFGADPFRADARIYRSGDIARWNEEGQMVFLGRRDHQVKISGARIELGEIEAHLRALQGIQDAVVAVVQFARHAADGQDAHCLRCGLPANYPGIVFNDEGVCDLCTDFDTFRDDVFQYFKTMDDLQAIIETAKAERQGDYDCMMLYSGGKDSTYVLSQLVEMGLKVLAFSLDNGYISDEAIENIKRITDHLGVDLVFGRTPHMNAIFTDSLERHSNVCQGCYKTIYTLSMALARQKGIKYIFTGLSRGQLFETRLDELFRNRMFDVEQMDNAVLEARKVYHRVDDAVHQLLDVSMFRDDRIFEEVQFIDYFRYTDVELDNLYDFLSTRVPWIRPTDTGRSTNCLINEAGIYVHQTERGYHNYALPYSWDVRLGHKTREEAMEELDDDMRLPLVKQMLAEVGYEVSETRSEQSEKRLAAYFTTKEEASITPAALRTYLAGVVPAYMVPAYFIHLEALPLTPNGKVDQRALPNPTSERPDMTANYVEPETTLQKQLAAIWSQTLNVGRIGIHDSFFDLGGASIPAVQVVARISGRFDVAFPVSSFFEHPTIAEQAELLEELLLDQLEALSDEEVAALLAEMGD